MVGSISTGFTSAAKKENHYIVTTHCFIHRDVLVSETLVDEMKKF
jgi:hypothetical protein